MRSLRDRGLKALTVLPSYDGAYPDTPRAALDFVRSLDPKSDLGHRLTPWIPVIGRILAGKDVGLKEILALVRRRDKP